MYLQRYHDDYFGSTYALEHIIYGYTRLVTMNRKSTPQSKKGP